MISVLRDWVQQLPLREQGTLIVALRGCDLAPKYPLDSPERRLTAALRYAVCIPADEREVDSELGCFMISQPPLDFKLSMVEQYPLHWVIHIVHACETLAYRHPDAVQASLWNVLYQRAVHSLHMVIEPKEQFIARLSENRIAKGTVVQ